MQQRALFGPAPNNLWLRLVISNAPDGRPEDISLMEIDGDTGSPIRAYLIPVVAKTTTIREFSPPPVKPVDIPPVSAEAEETADEKAEEKDKKTGSDDE